jgi:hypothetical protein
VTDKVARARGTIHAMERSSDLTVEFTLAPAALRYSVDVRLRRAGDRWIAVSRSGNSSLTGIGTSPRAALTAALEPLGKLAMTVLMADTGLLEPSLTVAQAAAG